MYSGSPYNGAVVQGKPPTTVIFKTIIGVTVIGNRPFPTTVPPTTAKITVKGITTVMRNHHYRNHSFGHFYRYRKHDPYNGKNNRYRGFYMQKPL